MANKNPAVVTLWGRLSFPIWTMAEALARNADAPVNIRRKEDTVSPEFSLLLEENQYEKFMTHVKDVYLPWQIQNFKLGEKRQVLDEKQVKQILSVLEGDLELQPPHIPLKVVGEKSLALAPESVARIKVNGTRGQDIVKKAVVNGEDELTVPDPDRLVFPYVAPIQQTVHELYPGCIAAATLNLYSFVSGKLPGFSASAGTIVFKADAERFGGGVAIDEEDIFAD